MRRAEAGSTRSSSARNAARPCSRNRAASRSRTARAVGGNAEKPCSKARKYRPVPPTNSGTRPWARMAANAAVASRRKRPAE